MISDGNTIKKSLPNIMKWVQIYLICTILLYLFGPIRYVKYNLELVLILLVVYQLFLLFGYSKGIRKTIRIIDEEDYRSAKDFTLRDQRFIVSIGIVGIFFDILMMYRMANTWNITTIFQKILNITNWAKEI